MNFDNNFLQAVFQNMADGIVACDENGTLIFFNDALEKMHGIPLQPLPPEDWAKKYNLYYPDGSGLLKKEDVPLYKAWKGEKVDHQEMMIISNEGQRKYMYANGNQLKDSDGKVIGAVINMHDITDINETNKKLNEIRHFIEQISDLTPGLITVFNVTNGVYRYVNNAAKTILGYTAQEFLNGGFEFVVSLVHSEDVQKILEQNQKAIINANEKYPDYNDNDAVEFEYRMKHKNGSYIWVHTYGVVFGRDTNHCVEEILNITVDITERKNAEIKAEQSKISEDYFRDLADQSPFMIWKVNEKGLCTYVNKPWCDFTGLSFKDSLNFGWRKAIHPDDGESEYIKFMNCFNELKPYHSKFRVKTISGDYRWVLAQSNPLKQPDKGYLGSLTDITEQEDAQQATKVLMQKKDEFMSIASHELKTPITSMKAALQIVQRISGKNKKDSQLHSFITLANNQVNKLSVLIEDLLDVTKIQAGKMELNKNDFESTELIKECISQYRFDSNIHKIIFKQNVNVTISGDKERLAQVIANFLSNAIKYSPEADKIIVASEITDNSLKVSVTDFGIGIPENNIKYIFDRFFRVEKSSQKFSGLGLGLFISAQIIEKHNGKIGVNSKEGQGSTFWFTIPCNNFLQKQ